MYQINIYLARLRNFLIKFIKEEKYFVIFFILAFFVFMVWLVAFYPAIMTPDSTDQWSQGYHMAFNNHHPYLHSLILGILQRIWYNPAFIALIQIFIASFLAAYFLSYLIKKGLNKFIAIFLLLLYVSSPSIGIFNVTIWKDIPFSFGIFALCIIFVVNYLEGGFPRSKIKFTFFILLIVTISYLRHNGILFIFLIPFLYYFFKLVSFKRFIILISSCILGYIFVNSILAGILQVTKPNFINSVTFLHLIGAAVDSGYTLNEYQEGVISKYISIESLKDKYECFNANPLVFNNPDFNGMVIEDSKYKKEFDSVALGIIRRNIPVIAANRTCMLLNIIGFNSVSFLYGDPGIPEHMIRDYGLTQYVPNDLSNLMLRYVTASLRYKIPEHVYWNVMPYIIITLLTFVIKRNKLTLGYLIISLFNLIPLFIGGVGPDYRFVYSIQITGIFALALLALPNRNIKNEVLGWIDKKN